MKGLLLKDFYTITKYCRIFFLVIIVFIAISCFGSESVFFILYPLVFAGMIPTTLFSYDEREKWNITCETLPCTRTQYVNGKYLMGLILQIAVLILSAIAQAVKMSIVGTFELTAFLSIIAIMFGFCLFIPTIILPLLFRFGAEKGRIVYLVVIGILCAATAALFGFDVLNNIAATQLISPILCSISVVLFALSWVLSVMFYKKREF